ncbi:MAG: NusG domain II-containing protein [Candidatus Omnitrophica bacterium]|nr:NusG domain II-containing protein [Candidatus Omnitrophota bacterium]
MKTHDEDLAFYAPSATDVVLAVIILGCSLFFIVSAFSHRYVPASPGILIYHEQALLSKISLSKDGVVPILNGKMQIEVKGGRVRVLESDCPQHVCMRTGWIQYVGQTIVCVPNHILIEIKSTAPQILDAVAY